MACTEDVNCGYENLRRKTKYVNYTLDVVSLPKRGGTEGRGLKPPKSPQGELIILRSNYFLHNAPFWFTMACTEDVNCGYENLRRKTKNVNYTLDVVSLPKRGGTEGRGRPTDRSPIIHNQIINNLTTLSVLKTSINCI